MRASGTMRKPRELIVSMGKEFACNKWGVSFVNSTHNFSFHLEEGFNETIPFPGKILNSDEIKEMIGFLQQTLEEEENEQSNLE
jgi:hypothetical protein